MATRFMSQQSEDRLSMQRQDRHGELRKVFHSILPHLSEDHERLDELLDIADAESKFAIDLLAENPNAIIMVKDELLDWIFDQAAKSYIENWNEGLYDKDSALFNLMYNASCQITEDYREKYGGGTLCSRRLRNVEPTAVCILMNCLIKDYTQYED